jgi:hypothetical protein
MNGPDDPAPRPSPWPIGNAPMLLGDAPMLLGDAPMLLGNAPVPLGDAPTFPGAMREINGLGDPAIRPTPPRPTANAPTPALPAITPA